MTHARDGAAVRDVDVAGSYELRGMRHGLELPCGGYGVSVDALIDLAGTSRRCRAVRADPAADMLKAVGRGPVTASSQQPKTGGAAP